MLSLKPNFFFWAKEAISKETDASLLSGYANSVDALALTQSAVKVFFFVMNCNSSKSTDCSPLAAVLALRTMDSLVWSP